MDDVIRRVSALEKGQELIISKLDGIAKGITDGRIENEKRFGAIEGRLTGIERALDAKASSADVKLIEGKVSSIPTTWQVVGLMGALVVSTLGGVAGLAFALARYLKP